MRMWDEIALLLDADAARSRDEAEAHATAVRASIDAAACDHHWSMTWLAPCDFDEGEG